MRESEREAGSSHRCVDARGVFGSDLSLTIMSLRTQRQMSVSFTGAKTNLPQLSELADAAREGVSRALLSLSCGRLAAVVPQDRETERQQNKVSL